MDKYLLRTGDRFYAFTNRAGRPMSVIGLSPAARLTMDEAVALSEKFTALGYQCTILNLRGESVAELLAQQEEQARHDAARYGNFWGESNDEPTLTAEQYNSMTAREVQQRFRSDPRFKLAVLMLMKQGLIRG
jgi:hypothetical protein